MTRLYQGTASAVPQRCPFTLVILSDSEGSRACARTRRSRRTPKVLPLPCRFREFYRNNRHPELRQRATGLVFSVSPRLRGEIGLSGGWPILRRFCEGWDLCYAAPSGLRLLFSLPCAHALGSIISLFGLEPLISVHPRKPVLACRGSAATGLVFSVSPRLRGEIWPSRSPDHPICLTTLLSSILGFLRVSAPPR